MLMVYDPPPSAGYPIERHFDLAWLAPLRGRMVEIDGASPTRRDEVRRAGDELARYLLARGHDYVITALPVASPWAIEPVMAMSPDDLRVFPRYAIEPAGGAGRARGTALLHAWLDLGAWVCGEPGRNPRDGTMQLPLLLSLARMPARPVRQLLARCA